MSDFLLRQIKGPWAAAALLCFALYVLLLALAGETVNAPFVYAPPT